MDSGYMISVIDNDFFDNFNLKDFIYEVKDRWHFFGMIVLPNSIFKNVKKSIFILQRIGESFVRPEKFLVADLPEFSNEEEMIKVIKQLNDWFEKIEFYRVRENNE
jgi:site-specific DNA-methyltransferase (adenine-specific)